MSTEIIREIETKRGNSMPSYKYHSGGQISHTLFALQTKIGGIKQLITTGFVLLENSLRRILQAQADTLAELKKRTDTLAELVESKSSVQLKDISLLQKELKIDRDTQGLGAARYLSWQIDDRLYETQQLLSKFKSEILFEVNRNSGYTNKPVPPKVVKKSKLKLKKLNLGSGSDTREDFINVDNRELPGIDVVADLGDLGLAANHFEEIIALHVLEHFTEIQAKALLPYWYSLLASGGKLRIVVPNIEMMAQDLVAKQKDWQTFRQVVLGGQDYIGNHHFNAFSPDSLKDLVSKSIPEAEVEVITTDRENFGCRELEVEITKP